MLYVPDLPPNHCTEAALAQLFVIEAAHSIEQDLVGGVDELTGQPLTEQQKTGRVRRLERASQYLAEAVNSCMICQVYQDSDTVGCPNDQSQFGFVRTVLL